MLESLKQEISAAAQASSSSVKFVAIDGHGGSGKTTLAAQLAQELGAQIIHTDDFASYTNPMDWWQRMVDEVFIPVQNGATHLSYERGAWYKDHKPEPVSHQPVTPVVIIEGVSSSRNEFRKYLTYSIWVDTPLGECARRGIERDLSDNKAKKTATEIKEDWTKWHKYELEYVKRDNPLSFVDKVIDGTKSYSKNSKRN